MEWIAPANGKRHEFSAREAIDGGGGYWNGFRLCSPSISSTNMRPSWFIDWLINWSLKSFILPTKTSRVSSICHRRIAVFRVAIKAWASHLTFSKLQVSLLWDGCDNSYLTGWLWGLNGAMCTGAQHTGRWPPPLWPFPGLAHKRLRAQMWAVLLSAAGLPVGPVP